MRRTLDNAGENRYGSTSWLRKSELKIQKQNVNTKKEKSNKCGNNIEVTKNKTN